MLYLSEQWSSWHRHMSECHGEDMKCYGNCVDPHRGIYFVYSLEGTAASYPVHLQCKTVGSESNIQSEVERCLSVAWQWEEVVSQVTSVPTFKL